MTALPDIVDVNDDDDDSNGISDNLQQGSVTGEDDTYAVQLTVPQEVKYGATVTLTAPGDKVRISDQADGGGTVFIDSTHSSYTWTIGQQTPPQTIYVNPIAASYDLNDVALALSDTDSGATQQPARPTYAQANPPRLTIREVSVFRNGRQVLFQNGGQAGNPTDTMVGGQNFFSTVVIPAALQQNATYRWQVSGTVISDYVPGSQAGTVTPLGQNELGSPDIHPYWLNGTFQGAAQTAAVTVSAGGGAPVTRTATLRVFRPNSTLTYLRPKLDNILIGPSHWGDICNTALDYGTPNDVGNSWTATVTTPAIGAGDIGTLQLTRDNVTRVTNAGASLRWRINGQWLVDASVNNFLYGEQNRSAAVAGGAQATLTHDDSPHGPLDGNTSYTRDFTAHTYLMYRPSGGIWVPLQMFEWAWRASVFVNNQGAWQFSDTSPSAGRGGPWDTTDEPTWTDARSNYNGGPNEWVAQ